MSIIGKLISIGVSAFTDRAISGVRVCVIMLGLATTICSVERLSNANSDSVSSSARPSSDPAQHGRGRLHQVLNKIHQIPRDGGALFRTGNKHDTIIYYIPDADAQNLSNPVRTAHPIMEIKSSAGGASVRTFSDNSADPSAWYSVSFSSTGVLGKTLSLHHSERRLDSLNDLPIPHVQTTGNHISPINQTGWVDPDLSPTSTIYRLLANTDNIAIQPEHAHIVVNGIIEKLRNDVACGNADVIVRERPRRYVVQLVTPIFMKDANTAAKTSHLRSDVTLVFYREQKGENLQLAYVDPKHSGRLVRSGLEPEKVNEILAEVAPLSTGSHDVLSRAAPSQEVAAVRTAYVDEKIGILLAQARERSDIHVTVHAGKSKSKLTKNLYASLTIVFSHTVDEKNVLLGSVTVIPTRDDSDRSIAKVTKVTIPIPTYLEAPAIEGAPAANTHESIPKPNLAPETLEALSLAIAAAEEKAAAKTNNESSARAIRPPNATPPPAENPAAGTTEGSLGDLSEALEKGASSKKKKKKKKKRW